MASSPRSASGRAGLPPANERLVLAVAAAGLALAALLCVGEMALLAAPWWAHPTQERTALWRAGRYGLSVQITNLPGCSPLQFGCPAMTPGGRTYLSIWFSVDQRHGAATTAWARPLAQVPLR